MIATTCGWQNAMVYETVYTLIYVCVRQSPNLVHWKGTSRGGLGRFSDENTWDIDSGDEAHANFVVRNELNVCANQKFD
jgi:hypothetical protein